MLAVSFKGLLSPKSNSFRTHNFTIPHQLLAVQLSKDLKYFIDAKVVTVVCNKGDKVTQDNMHFILYAYGHVGIFRACIYRRQSTAYPVMALIFCAHLFWGNKVFMTPHCPHPQE